MTNRLRDYDRAKLRLKKKNWKVESSKIKNSTVKFKFKNTNGLNTRKGVENYHVHLLDLWN